MSVRPRPDPDEGAILGQGCFGRREFLSIAGQAGGALVIGLAVPGCAPKRGGAGSGDGASAAAAGSGGTSAAADAPGELNAWLRIGSDDAITVLVDRSEMGQGVYTALPMLLAEELAVPIDAIRIVAAPVGDAYVNVGNGGQVTGTSNSVQDAWDKLRLAGAQARTMLIAAAAAEWNVDAAGLKAAGGAVTDADGRRLTYGALAAAAAGRPIPKDVKLKPPAEFTLIGRGLARLDTPGKVDGSAEFGIDVKLPKMLYAAFAQAPSVGGKLRHFDAAAAEALPGVHKVFAHSGGVVVVADHYWQALRAREALKIDWDAGVNATLDNAAVRAQLQATLAAGPGLSARAEGDVGAALAHAHKTLTGVYELPLLAHATMEPMNCTADVKADACAIYVGTQVQKMAQVAAAQAAGISPERVSVYTTLLGGGFGRRLDVDFIPAAVAASKAVQRPVKLIWTREDDMTHDFYRPPALLEMRGALAANGDLEAWAFHAVSPSITARFAPETTDPFDSVLEGSANYPYGVPNVSVTYTRREVGVDVGYMRSVSHAINCYGIESFMDELAIAAGKDALAFRRGLLGAKPRHLRVLEAAATRAGWGRAPKGRHHGIALMEGYTTHIAQVAEVSVEHGALKVHKIVCVVDCGQIVNPKIVASQIEGGIVFGLSSALWGAVTLARGAVQETNFNGYRVARIHELPELDVEILASDAPPGGIGEASVALVAPAIGNAIFAATGKRVRALPFAAQGWLKV
jgi:isoquinoline 1-oxidoreductase beta subunit